MNQNRLPSPSLIFCCYHINQQPPPQKKKKAFETNQAKIVVNDNHFAWHLVTKDPTLVCLPCIPCH